MQKALEFPASLCYSPALRTQEYKLYKSVDGTFAFYFSGDVGFGFGHAIEIERMIHKDNPQKTIVQVQYLSGNSWGTTSEGKPRSPDDPYSLHYLVARTDYYPTMQRAIDALTGKTEVPKGKRKARPIQPMTNQELEAWSKS
jgi:hypothetical protein